MSMQNKLLITLKNKGYRLTSVRVFVINFLETHKKPFDVITIQTALAKSVKKVNKTTVYREMEFLLSQGLIKQVNFGDGKNRYELSNLPHHHHLVCDKCHTIEDIFFQNELKTIESKIKKTKKFSIKRHVLEFFGVCHTCSSK